jgi:hypothetical protein
MTIKYIEKEHDTDAEATIYWFNIDDVKYGVLEGGIMDGVVVDENKNTVDAHDAQSLPNMTDLITESLIKADEVEQYRFEYGSLYEYDEESNAYIHIFKQAGCNNKRDAIREYEKQTEAEQNCFTWGR